MILFDWLRPGGVAPSMRTACGVVLGLAGLVLVVRHSSSSPVSPMENWGKLALMFAVVSWAVGALYSRHVHARGSALLPMARQMILAGALLLTLSFFHGDWAHFSFRAITAASCSVSDT